MTGKMRLIFIQLVAIWIQNITPSESDYFQFNGTNYISNMFITRPPTSIRERLIIEFQTMQQEGHLFYAGNREHGISVSIERGILHASVRIPMQYTGPEEAILNPLTMKQPTIKLDVVSKDNYYNLPLNDGQWHVFEFERKSERIEMRLDEATIYQKELNFERNSLSSLKFEQIILGRSYMTTNGNGAQKSKLFIGLVSRAHFIIDGAFLDLIEYAKGRNHNFKILTVDASQGLPPKATAKPGVTFVRESREDAFLKLRLRSFPSPIRAGNSSRIDFTIYSNEYSSGLLFYLTNSSPNRLYHPNKLNLKFLAMEFYEMDLFLVLKTPLDNSTRRYNLTRMSIEKNLISINLSNGILEVRVNLVLCHSEALDGTIPGNFGHNLYLGGLNFLVETELDRVEPKLISWSTLKKNFIGSICAIRYNHEFINIEDALVARGLIKSPPIIPGSLNSIKKSCNDFSPTCFNNAICQEGFNRPLCLCDKRLAIGPRCNNRIDTVILSGYINLKFPIEQRTFVDHFELSIQTLQLDGVIFRTFDDSRVDLMRENLRDNYLLIFLKNGQLHIMYKFGEDTSSFKFLPKINNSKWHYISMIRSWDQIQVQIDENHFNRKLQKSEEYLLKVQRLFLNQNLTSSARLEYSQLSLGRSFISQDHLRVDKVTEGRGLVGNIRHFCFNKYCPFEDVTLKMDNSSVDARYERIMKANYLSRLSRRKRAYSASTYSVEVSKENPSSLRLPPAYPISFSSADCFIQTHSLILYDKFSLQFSFRTRQPNGLILYNEAIKGTDFLAFELINGQFQMVYDMGEGIDWHKIQSAPLSDNQWHQVTFSRDNIIDNILNLRIDSNDQKTLEDHISVKGGDRVKNFDLKGPLYLGGAPKDKFMKARERFTSPFGFQGCLGNFTFNQNDPAEDILSLVYPNSDAATSKKSIEGVNESSMLLNYSYNCIKAGCDESVITTNMKSCFKMNNFCYNGGECLHHWEALKCYCDMTTFSGQRCNRAGTTIHLKREKDGTSLNSYVQVMFTEKKTSSRDEIAIGFQVEASSVNRTHNLDEKTLEFINGKKFRDLFDQIHTIHTLLYISSENEEDFIHILLVNGKIVAEYDVGGGSVARTNFNQVLDDGFYHRVLVYRNGPRMQVHIDDSVFSIKSEVMAVQFNGQKSIYLGHYPQDDVNDYFPGFLSGIYVNGLLVNDLIVSKKLHMGLVVRKFGKVEFVDSFHPSLSQNSTFRINNDYEIHHQFDVMKNDISQYNYSLIQGDAEFKQEIKNSKSSREQPVGSLWSSVLFNNGLFTGVNSDVNIWLIFTLSITGILLTLSMVYFMYRCQMKASERFKNRMTNEDATLVTGNEPSRLLQDSFNNNATLERSTNSIFDPKLGSVNNTLLSQQLNPPPQHVRSCEGGREGWLYPTFLHQNENIILNHDESEMSGTAFLQTGYYLQS